MIFAIFLFFLVEGESRRHHHRSTKSSNGRGRNRGHYRKHRFVPMIKMPKQNKYELLAEIGKAISPHDLSFVDKVSHVDRELILELIYRTRPPLDRLLSKYSQMGKLQGDYLFDEKAADLLQAMKNQKKAGDIFGGGSKR